LLRRRSLTVAVLLSTLIFAAIHWSYGPGITIFAALAGLMFASLYIATSNLALPVMAHAGFDAVVFAGGVGAVWRIYSQA
jgi:membrane protease YdiL (CAAX protease family)